VTAKQTAAATEPSEAELRKRYDEAVALRAEWASRLRAAEVAQSDAEASATASVVADPGAVEKIVSARAEAAERGRVTREVLAQATAAMREAGRALLPFAAARYDKADAQAKAELAAFDAEVRRHVDALVQLIDRHRVDVDAFRADEHVRLEAQAMRARRDAELCRWAHEDPAGCADTFRRAGKRNDKAADLAMADRLGPAMGQEPGFGGRHPVALKAPAGRMTDLPAELRPDGCFPLL